MQNSFVPIEGKSEYHKESGLASVALFCLLSHIESIKLDHTGKVQPIDHMPNCGV
jgi:hypothetical protein